MKQTKRKRKITKKALLLLDAILLLALVFALYKLITIRLSYRESKRQYDALAAMAVQTPEPEPEQTPLPDATPVLAGSMPSELPITVDWAALRQINPDLVGWLYCADTPINYPVVQSADNEYYLDRSFERKSSDGGALFLDCRNQLSAPEGNLIIYGHRMKDDSMFGTLPSYTARAYYEKHPVLYLLTETQSYRIEVFACRTVRGDAKYFPTYFDTPEKYRSFLSQAAGESYWQTDEPFRTDAPTLTLATCSSYTHADDPRLLVHGRMIPVS